MNIARSRAFALPMVVMLTAIAGIMIGVLLDRQSAQALSVKRQADDYREHHFGRGAKEIIDYWLRTRGNKPVRELLDESGKALDVTLADGTVISLRLFDAQGTLNADRATLAAAGLPAPRRAYDELAATAGPRLQSLTRKLGPVEVSLGTASPEVIAAIVNANISPEKQSDLTAALLDLRGRSSIAGEDLSEALSGLGLDNPERDAITRMVAVDPTFFRAILEARTPDGRIVARYGGYAVIGSMAQRGKSDSGGRRTSILAWTKLQVR
ncbi:MAG: hypothetical protein IT432_06665 [Phycisphaerales bacterium]|nr:hypothetical protein [Phycisphaerales bacterium]